MGRRAIRDDDDTQMVDAPGPSGINRKTMYSPTYDEPPVKAIQLFSYSEDDVDVHKKTIGIDDDPAQLVGYTEKKGGITPPYEINKLIEEVLQSHQDVPIDETFSVTVGIIHLPRDAGRMKVTSLIVFGAAQGNSVIYPPKNQHITFNWCHPSVEEVPVILTPSSACRDSGFRPFLRHVSQGS